MTMTHIVLKLNSYLELPSSALPTGTVARHSSNDKLDYSIYAQASPSRMAQQYRPAILPTDLMMPCFGPTASLAKYSPPWRDIRHFDPPFYIINNEGRQSPSPEEEDYVILDMKGNCASSRDCSSPDLEGYETIELVDGGVDEEAICAVASNSVSDSEDDGMPALEGPEFSKEEKLSILKRAAEQHIIQWGDGNRDVIEKVAHAIVNNLPSPHWVHSDRSLNDLD